MVVGAETVGHIVPEVRKRRVGRKWGWASMLVSYDLLLPARLCLLKVP